MVKTSVVILNWNGMELLRQFLPSVTANTINAETEVVVADNGSTDASCEFIKTHYPQVRLIELDRNYGFALGYNKAIKQIEASYIVLLNSDVEVSEGWLNPLVSYMDANPEVAACGPKIIDFNDRTKFEYAGAAGGFIDRYGFPYCRGRVFDAIEKDSGQYDTVEECLWVSGCCLLVRKQVFEAEGGLDDRFFAHMEEIDFCWRITNRGYKVVNIPQSVVYHVGGASLSAQSPQKTFLNFRNSLLCLYKNTPAKSWMSFYSARLVLDGIAAVKFLLTDGPKHFLAVIRAHLKFRSMKGFYIKQQVCSNPNLKIPQNKNVMQKSLVVQFYLKRKTLYTSLQPTIKHINL